jgi:hypothetical protein
VSLLDKLFGGRRLPQVSPELVQRVVDVIGNVVERVRDRGEARERLARAARRGDLDFLLEAVEADKKRAEDYVRRG